MSPRPARIALALAFALASGLAFATSAAAQSPDPWAQIDALRARGRTNDAERAARTGGAATRVALADLLLDRGRLPEADSALRLVTGDAPDARTAMVLRAELAALRGDMREAERRANTVVREFGLTRSTWNARDHIALGRAHLLLAEGDAEAVRRALRAFDDAAERDSTIPDAPLRAAELFLSRFNPPEARAGFEDVLKRWPNHPRALLGLARVKQFVGEGDAFDAARAAVEADPTVAAAHLTVAQLWTDLEMQDSALVSARRAIAADSTTLEAYGIIGAVAWTYGDSVAFRESVRLATAASPRPAAYYVALSDAAARQRRYAEAEEFAARAVAIDSSSLKALAALGTNQLRRGRMESGRIAIERAFGIDPFNLWHKNTLDMLDLMSAFRTDTVGRFVYVGRAKELDVLLPMLVPLLEGAYDRFATRYNYRPPTLIRLELFDLHSDFSVRTVGLTGLGALGVSFGTVLAMDTPSARPPGTFNWGSTAWHELAHTFTLGLSAHRVPRWFSEGMSVVEEWRAQPGWGAEIDTSFVRAHRAGLLHPVSRLNEGFARPRDPGEVSRSYVHAALVCEMIEATFGADAPARMLRAWAEGLATADVVQRALGVDESALDRQFKEWLNERLGGSAFRARVGDTDVSAIRSELAAAERAGRDSAAVVARERLFWVWPYDMEQRIALAAAASRAGMTGRAVRELRIVLALGAPDPLAARTALARALLANGERNEARREVLRVLEEAPTYDEALTLLLEIRRAPPESR
jgi:tetratricopeptide (TPR) repeat protein